MEASDFNALTDEDKADHLERIEEEKMYFGLIMEYKVSMSDVLVFAYNFERLPQE